MEKKKRNVLMWVLLILLPPIGIIYMWVAKKEMPGKKKGILTAVFAVWLIFVLAIGGGGEPTDSKTAATIKTPQKEESKETAAPKKDISISELSAAYSGSTEEGTVIDNSNKGITVSAKYTDGSEAKSLGGWDIENPSPLVAGQTTTYNVKFSDSTCKLDITCTTPAMSMGQENALQKGKDYLDYTSFSYSGLISQLEFDGFSTEDATYAADNCGADWNAQAASKAGDYLDYTSFSREGLIEQLEFDGFSAEQAEYGATAVGY